jgi:hypothetical protein
VELGRPWTFRHWRGNVHTVSRGGRRLPWGFHDRIGGKLWLPKGYGPEGLGEHIGRAQLDLDECSTLHRRPNDADFTVSGGNARAQRASVAERPPASAVNRVQVRADEPPQAAQQPSRLG